MDAKRNAVMGLRIVTGVTILMGVAGMAAGILAPKAIPIMGVHVPHWVLGLLVAYMGIRHWRRLPEIEKRAATAEGFSWANFMKR